MKYGSRQSQQARSAAQGAKGKCSSSTPPVSESNPVVRNKTQPAEDLFASVEGEDDLAERLKAHGCDIYAGGPYETYADRLGACIVRNRMQAVIVGRAPDGKPENYAQAYERLYGRDLPKLESRVNKTQSVPRGMAHGGQHETHTPTEPGVPRVDHAPDAAAAGGAAGAKARG